MIDLTIHEQPLERAVQRARERNIIIPTFEQQRNPALIPDAVKRNLADVGLWDLNPVNLFRINWHNEPTARGGGCRCPDGSGDGDARGGPAGTCCRESG